MFFHGLPQASQLTNGSFEAGISGWTATTPATVRSDEQPSDGTLALVFDWGNVPGGAVQQSFVTAAGAVYTLTFDYWGWGGPAVHTLQVDVVGASTLLNQTVTATGSIPPSYRFFSQTFVADSSSAKLSFLNLTSAANGLNSDVNIDRVAVTLVPEPATVAQLLGGLAALLLLRKGTRRGSPLADA